MKVAIYTTSSGNIVRFIDCPPDHISMQLSEGEDFYLNCPEGSTHIINDEPFTPVPEGKTIAGILAVVRMQRDCKLLASDWTQTMDAPLAPEKRTEWAVYRQTLRDFPGTCNPYDPVWPVAP